MSLKPPPKMLSRLRDEEGRAYHDATMQKRRADAMFLARIKEKDRIAKIRRGWADPDFGPNTSATITTTSAVLRHGPSFVIVDDQGITIVADNITWP